MRTSIALLVALALFAIAETAGAHPREAPSSAVATVSAETRAADPTPETRSELPPTPTTSGWMLALLGMALLVGLAVPMMREPDRRLRATALATSLLVVAFVSASGPHLVHHALDPEQAKQCHVLNSASHTEGATVVLDVPVAPRVERPLGEVPPQSPPALAPPATRGRAPPPA